MAHFILKVSSGDGTSCQTLGNLVVNSGLSRQTSSPMFLLQQHERVLCALDPEFLPALYRDKEEIQFVEIQNQLGFTDPNTFFALVQGPIVFCPFSRSSSTPDTKCCHGTLLRTGYSIPFSLACPRMPCCFQVYLSINPLLVSLGLS